MSNRIRNAQVFDARTGEYPIYMYIHWIIGGELDFDANYQRGYVWGHEEQQTFLNAVISGFPIGSVALAKAPDWCSREPPYIEVVDGKQRLTTLKKLITNEIPIILADGPLYWRDMTRAEQLAFGRHSLPAVVLDEVTYKDRLAYFMAVNFTGVPQSEEHKRHVMQLMETAQ
ncbi:DUF262 domain-containing protein [Salmonella enterica subsp. diarizonae]|nr:DUF262 domain-containing protein [Salmonella enterica subsp. diarizonae]EDU5553948.1 DUF262 domain-containing protein [Salmonella enterica subsp. diarizonae]EDU8161672.1 DUF262 domain-containing protein [Salmonella enterica subsp. diarizonae]EDZ4084100.1 DUF262 domain-containing protein [Salmonella enterica]EEM3072641.1 DUF262 domain-containing protein [Salmonella enterica subsp. enterica serovar Java]